MNNGCYLAIVRDNEDPMEMGRLRVFIPGYDAPYLTNDELPWANMMTPFFGVTEDMVAGRDEQTNSGGVAYGFWNVPKIGSKVVVTILNNEECSVS